jgi:hypothetical protein
MLLCRKVLLEALQVTFRYRDKTSSLANLSLIDEDHGPALVVGANLRILCLLRLTYYPSLILTASYEALKRDAPRRFLQALESHLPRARNRNGG